jgi:hypothetical protein
MKYVLAFINGFTTSFSATLKEADAMWNRYIAAIDAKYPGKKK